MASSARQSQQAQQVQLTAEDLFALSGTHEKCELLKGELTRMVLAGGEHGKLIARLSRLLDEYVEAQNLGVVCGAQAGYVLQKDPDTVRAPDASFVSSAHLPPAGIPKDYWPFAPDLAVEVVAPADRFEAMQTKVAEYFSAGTRLVWVVEPATRTIFVYRSLHDVQALGETDELNGGDVIDGFRCPVKRVFD